jgi:hypothetical protein
VGSYRALICGENCGSVLHKHCSNAQKETKHIKVQVDNNNNNMAEESLILGFEEMEECSTDMLTRGKVQLGLR